MLTLWHRYLTSSWHRIVGQMVFVVISNSKPKVSWISCDYLYYILRNKNQRNKNTSSRIYNTFCCQGCKIGPRNENPVSSITCFTYNHILLLLGFLNFSNPKKAVCNIRLLAVLAIVYTGVVYCKYKFDSSTENARCFPFRLWSLYREIKASFEGPDIGLWVWIHFSCPYA